MQGFNMGRYNAPASLDPSLSADRVGGFNKQGDQRPRAPDGSIVVRFEMPFKIWCSGCSPEAIIDQGSRFNATKKSIGKFFTTTRYEFKMKHADCGKTITIQTDPLGQTYQVIDGGRRQDWEFKSLEAGGDVGEAVDLENPKDGFAIQEAAQYQERKNNPAVSDKRINELLKANQKYQNADALNAQARRRFRQGRLQRTKAEEEAEKLGKKFALPFEVLAVTQEDKDRAGETVFGHQDAEKAAALEEYKANARSIFDKTPNKKSFVRPPGIKDHIWNRMKAIHDLQEAADLQRTESMQKEMGTWDMKRKKRRPEEILSKLAGRLITKHTGIADQEEEEEEERHEKEEVKVREQQVTKKIRLVEYSESEEE